MNRFQHDVLLIKPPVGILKNSIKINILMSENAFWMSIQFFMIVLVYIEVL